MRTLVHLLLLLALPPLLLGVIAKTKAFFAGRRGPALVQPYRDLTRLARKGMVLSATTTWVFLAAPVVTLAATLAAALLVPLGPFPALVAFPGDFLLLIGLLGLARFFTASAALDTGSPFAGMGAAREVTFAFLAEPALLLGMLVCARLSGALSLQAMLRGAWKAAGPETAASLVLVTAGLLIAVLAENCRIPVDDPTTHLELTMIHEAMVLDASGPLLALVLYGAALRLLVFLALVVQLLVPFATGSAVLDWTLVVLAAVALAVTLGVVESVMARLPLRQVPTLLIAAVLCCAFGFLLLVR
jgi:formate hydrogenlyase subunit 4